MAMQINKIISWNMNGLNSASKRRQVYHWLNKQNSLITCIQEVHTKNFDQKYFRNKKLGEVFTSLIHKKKRGVAIYAKKELGPKEIFSDKQGRYIAIEINYLNTKVLIINIYAPNGPKTRVL